VQVTPAPESPRFSDVFYFDKPRLIASRGRAVACLVWPGADKARRVVGWDSSPCGPTPVVQPDTPQRALPLGFDELSTLSDG